MASGNPADPLEALDAVVQTATTLVEQLKKALLDITSSRSSASPPTGPSSTSNSIDDPLAVARDSASLIKAHSTKISLFIINKPFTPSAIVKVLRELVAGPVPALAAAAQACNAAHYTEEYRYGLCQRSQSLMADLHLLLLKIPKNGRVLSEEEKKGSDEVGRGSISVTGTLWAQCDEVVRFSSLGVSGYFVSKMETGKDILKDVMEELKEWSEDTGEEDDDAEDDADATEQDPEDHHSSTQAVFDALMRSYRTIPADDPDRIRERLDSCLKRLRLVTLLYQAIIKRRMKTLPSFPQMDPSTIPRRLDEVAVVLQRIPERFGDVALSFYELEVESIDRNMDQCFFDAFALSELLVKSWDGQRDEFTDWAEKFQVQIKKG